MSYSPETLKYAQSVGSIGKRMNKTAERFGLVSEKRGSTLEEIENIKRDYENLLNEFYSQEQELRNLTATTFLIQEHQELVSSFSKYVHATKKAINSLNTSNVERNQSLFKEAQNLQWEASNEIVKVTDKIAHKIGLK